MNHANRLIDYSHKSIHGLACEAGRRTSILDDAVNHQWYLRDTYQENENKFRLTRYEKRKCNS
jgi:hypothetical protein